LEVVLAGTKKVSGSPPARTRKKRALKTPTAAFLRFWAVYPLKVGKRRAFKAWEDGQCEALADQIVKAVEAQKRWPNGQGLNKHPESNGRGCINPHPTTWLNQGRWDDEQAEKSDGLEGLE
jgi:hypothetical protein